jgi:cytochrome c5
MSKVSTLSFLVAATTFIFGAAAQQQANVVSTPAIAATGTATQPEPAKTSAKSGASTSGKTTAIRVEPSLRIEGEKRFHANCSRCHLAPQKLPPRAAATIIRHMRVRASITDEDMRYILAYLTQ